MLTQDRYEDDFKAEEALPFLLKDNCLGPEGQDAPSESCTWQ